MLDFLTEAFWPTCDATAISKCKISHACQGPCIARLENRLCSASRARKPQARCSSQLIFIGGLSKNCNSLTADKLSFMRVESSSFCITGWASVRRCSVLFAENGFRSSVFHLRICYMRLTCERQRVCSQGYSPKPVFVFDAHVLHFCWCCVLQVALCGADCMRKSELCRMRFTDSNHFLSRIQHVLMVHHHVLVLFLRFLCNIILLTVSNCLKCNGSAQPLCGPHTEPVGKTCWTPLVRSAQTKIYVWRLGCSLKRRKGINQREKEIAEAVWGRKTLPRVDLHSAHLVPPRQLTDKIMGLHFLFWIMYIACRTMMVIRIFRQLQEDSLCWLSKVGSRHSIVWYWRRDSFEMRGSAARLLQGRLRFALLCPSPPAAPFSRAALIRLLILLAVWRARFAQSITWRASRFVRRASDQGLCVGCGCGACLFKALLVKRAVSWVVRARSGVLCARAPACCFTDTQQPCQAKSKEDCRLRRSVLLCNSTAKLTRSRLFKGSATNSAAQIAKRLGLTCGLLLKMAAFTASASSVPTTPIDSSAAPMLSVPTGVSTEDHHKLFILNAIDKLRERKARPDVDRITALVHRQHKLQRAASAAILEKLVDQGVVVRVEYKGSVSYRNAAKWKRSSLSGSVLNSSVTSRRLSDALRSLASDREPEMLEIGFTFEEIEEVLVRQPAPPRAERHHSQVSEEGDSDSSDSGGSHEDELRGETLRRALERESTAGGFVRLPGERFALDEDGSRRQSMAEHMAKRANKPSTAGAKKEPICNSSVASNTFKEPTSTAASTSAVVQGLKLIAPAPSSASSASSLATATAANMAHQTGPQTPLHLPVNLASLPAPLPPPPPHLPRPSHTMSQPLLPFVPSYSEQSTSHNSGQCPQSVVRPIPQKPIVNVTGYASGPPFSLQARPPHLPSVLPASAAASSLFAVQQQMQSPLQSESSTAHQSVQLAAHTLQQQPAHSSQSTAHSVTSAPSFTASASSSHRVTKSEAPTSTTIAISMPKRGRPPGSKKKVSSRSEMSSTSMKRSRLGNESGATPSSAQPVLLVAHSSPVETDATVSKRCDFCLSSAAPLLCCRTCQATAHPVCMNYTAQLAARAQMSPWQCSECKTCCICEDSTDDAELMLICDGCDKGYHTSCHSPPVTDKPPADVKWICSRCRASAEYATDIDDGNAGAQSIGAASEVEASIGLSSTRIAESTVEPDATGWGCGRNSVVAGGPGFCDCCQSFSWARSGRCFLVAHEANGRFDGPRSQAWPGGKGIRQNSSAASARQSVAGQWLVAVTLLNTS